MKNSCQYQEPTRFLAITTRALANGGSNRGASIDYNLIYGNGYGLPNPNDPPIYTAGECGANGFTPIVGPNNIFGSSPQFVNAPADWHVQSGSPAIDAGTTINTVTTDYEGNPRPTPGDPAQKYDIGAFQHKSN